MNPAPPHWLVTLEGTDSAELLARAREGDAESFWALCSPVEARLFRQAVALCGDEVQAKDLTQETLLEAWKSIHRFNGRCQILTWLCSILLHRHKSLLRRRYWQSLIRFCSESDQAFSLESISDQAPRPDQVAELSDQSRFILQSLDRLPPRQRAVVFLRFYADESLAGIAAALNCSIGTVKSRLFHGLDNLRQMHAFRKEPE